jgi:hypothetical protein
MDKFAHILRLLLIFPAVIAGIICSIGLVFSLITPVMIVPCVLVSIAIAYIYLYQFKLCGLIANNKPCQNTKVYFFTNLLSLVAGIVAVAYMVQYLNEIELVLFYPDIIFTLAAISHALASIILIIWYSRNKA